MIDAGPKLVLVYSKLCRSFTRNGHNLEIQIFRLEGKVNWQLDVVNEEGTSVVWHEQFATEKLADDAFCELLEREGMDAFVNNDDEHCTRFDIARLH
jgi:hypothetical protein